MKLPAHDRYDYVPIPKRPVYDWPEGKRLAVFFCNNIEHFAFGAGLGSDSTGRRRGAEPAQLRLARLRQPGRHLVLPRPARRVRAARRAQRQFGGARILPRHRRAAERPRRRICRPRPHQFRAPGRAVGGGRGAADRRMHRDRDPALRQAAGGLARPVPRAERRDARPAEGGRLPLCDGLGARRPADLDADPRRADPVGALPDRDQRLCRRWSTAATPAGNSPR